MCIWQTVSVVVAVGWLCVGGGVAEQSGPVGRWDLNEGRDGHIHDASGNENHGMAWATGWVEARKGYALEFDGVHAHVNCGNRASLDIRGPISMKVWMCPTAPATSETGIAGKSFTSYGLTYYTDGCVYWYIGNGGNKCSASVKAKVWSHVVATFNGKTMRLYVNGKPAGSNASQFDSVNRGGEFFIGCIKKGAPTKSFRGIVGSVRVYNRALSDKEVKGHYLSEIRDYPRTLAKYDRMLVTAYPYLDKGRIYLDVDFSHVAPVDEGVTGTVELRRRGKRDVVKRDVVKRDVVKRDVVKRDVVKRDVVKRDVVKRFPLPALPLTGAMRDVKLDVGEIDDGNYDLRVALASKGGVVSECMVRFTKPYGVAVLDPAGKTVGPLPEPPKPVGFGLTIGNRGGFVIEAKGGRYRFESTYSYPNGGYNVLGAGDESKDDAEPTWKAQAKKVDANTHEVTAAGKHYTIKRRIERRPTHVLVKDTITNTGDQVVGIMLSNHMLLDRSQGLSVRRLSNPSIFLHKRGLGLGLIALDDVYLEQHKIHSDGGRAGIRSDAFALDKGASYTLEWAVYVNGTGEYYDFINEARKDLDYAPTVEGGFAFTDRRKSPSAEYVANRALRYASIGCLGHVSDDPGLSLEGVEFVEYPKECELLRATFAETRRRYPDMKVMFHIAHSLYTTNKPKELFPDSRTLNSAGKQTDYGSQNKAYYVKYFSKERVEQGYRWYIFYPTMDNRFGKAMLDAIDYMLDKIGADSMFADGFSHGYGGRFTYDRWDGHTAEIDPKTKTVKRKYASVNLLAQDVLVEVCRRIAARGGVVIANSYPGTRTIHQQENLLYCLETAGGGRVCSRLHLAPSVIALGNPAKCESARDVYDDIRDKIEWGGLYFYYGEKSVPSDTIVTQMYPITVEEIGKGIIKGGRRIITLRSGVYGWRAGDELHKVYRYDGRGVPVPHGFATTVCSRGVRTKVDLLDREAAIVVKIPVTVESSSPVNVVVPRYDSNGVELVLHAAGDATVSIRDGAFKVSTGKAHPVSINGATKSVVAGAGGLSIKVPKGRQTTVKIVPATGG